MLPAAFVHEFPHLGVVRLRDAPVRVEHLVWSSLRPSPAAAAFLSMPGIAVTGASESRGG